MQRIIKRVLGFWSFSVLIEFDNHKANKIQVNYHMFLIMSLSQASRLAMHSKFIGHTKKEEI